MPIDLPFESASVEETMAFGEALVNDLAPGTVVALEGDLGAGKTHLVKGMARGLGIAPEAVRSPTFVILHAYEEGRLPLYHFDAYRVATPDEFYELGFEDYFYGDGISVVEWPRRVAELIPEEAVHLRLVHVAETRRRIEQGERSGP